MEKSIETTRTGHFLKLRKSTTIMSEAAPAQYKQPSRKGKKAWRKNVDVTQVSAGLDEVRDQIIAGYVKSIFLLHTFLIYA